MIKIGIVGYGNLGKAAEKAVAAAPDMELVAVFSRRKVISATGAAVVDYGDYEKYEGKIDVMLLCGGSATDLSLQSKEIARLFNTADTFDTHALALEHFNAIDKIAKDTKHVAAVSVGWDPGLFSHTRLLFESFLNDGKTYTFWGDGVSQGHSEAVRKIDGVKYAVQYTVMKKEAVDAVRKGLQPELSTRDKHKRICYVVAEDGADKAAVENTIVNMKNYFADYDTVVNFIGEEEFLKNHTGMPHGGIVVRGGRTDGFADTLELSIKLENNPSFTASVLTAYARAVYRLAESRSYGAHTVFDIPAYLTSPKSLTELISTVL